MSNETAGTRGGIPVIRGPEDVKSPQRFSPRIASSLVFVDQN